MSRKSKYSRRVFVQAAAAMGGVSMLPIGRAFADATTTEPHFLLQVLVPNSFDASYLFDARPRAMTAAGKIQNYFLTKNPTYDPTPWVGTNGVQTLASSVAAAALMPFKDRFSVLNGVLMSTDFDGHDQNQAFALTGNALGGESYLPHLNEIGLATPLDYLQFGQLFNVDVTNASASVQMQAASAKQLTSTLQASTSVAATDPALAMIYDRLKANSGTESGMYSQGANRMFGGLNASFGLGQKLKSVDVFGLDGQDELVQQLMLIRQYYVHGITRAALLVLDRYQGNDCHAPEQAKTQPELYATVAKDLAGIFQYLSSTKFDAAAGKSMLDVTTVVIMAEFSRTMRQTGKPIGDTGTDHNPLANEILIGGKGIKGGLVIGASDMESTDSVVSGAHRERDPELLKIMGKPFDFATARSTDEQPATFDVTKYLNFASVVNTIYGMFGAKESHYRVLFRNGPTAPSIAGILT